MVRRLLIIIFACALLPGLQLLDPQDALALEGGAKVLGGAGAAGKAHKDRELIVKFKDGALRSDEERVHGRTGGRTLKKYNRLGIHRVKVPDGVALEKAAMDYRSDLMVEYVEPNYAVTSLLIPNDSSLDLLWSLDNHGQTGGTPGADIGAFDAWDITTGGEDVVAVIIDTGIDYTHNDIVANMWVNEAEAGGVPGIDDDGNGYVDDVHGISVVGDNPDPMDDNGHGTHVAGIVGAVGNNGLGVTGISWNVKLMVCKFLDQSGSGYLDGALECLEYVRAMKERGVDIAAINNSWGCSMHLNGLFDAIASQDDVLFIAAAGNAHADNDAQSFSPGGFRLPNLISVSATDHNDEMAPFSNYGRRSVSVGAPGVDIISLRAKGTDMYGDGQHFVGGPGEPEYYRSSGTSMAAPYVTGLVALLKSRYPQMSWTTVRNLILSGGERLSDLEAGTLTGSRVSAHGSLTCMDKKVFSVIEYSFDVGLPNLLTALSIECGQPVGPVVATTPSGQTVVLLDDGVPPDRLAGDGIFAAVWVPTSGDARLTMSSPAGTEVITPRPSVDLTISRVEGPQSAYTGERITLRAQVQNVGELDAPFFSVYFYLSKDEAVGFDDIALGNANVMSLGGGEEQEVEATVRVPEGIDGGTYYLVALANLPDTVKESNETNNALTGGEVVIDKAYPDLVVSEVSGPASVETGRSITVKASVQNVEAVDAPFFSVYFYLSKDEAIGIDDIVLGNANVMSLEGGKERAVEATVRVPEGIDDGTYYLAALADLPNKVKESNETNNTAVGPVIAVQSVLPEIMVTLLSSADSVAAGSALTVSGKVTNTGSLGVSTFTVTVYLSSDPLITRDDTAIGTVALGFLQGGEERRFSATFVVPPTLPAGVHYVGAIPGGATRMESQVFSGSALSITGGDQMVAGDFNGDGRADIALLNASGEIFVTSDIAALVKIPGRLTRLAAGDFNGDGKSDISGINAADGSIWVSTDVAAATPAWRRIPGKLAELISGDFDGDGRSDLAGINGADGSIWLSMNVAAASPSWRRIAGTLAHVVSGNFDTARPGDELVGLTAGGQIWVTKTLPVPTWEPIPGVLSSLVVGDFNGDDITDLAGINKANQSIWVSTNVTAAAPTWANIPGAVRQLLAGRFSPARPKVDGLAGLAVNESIWVSTNVTAAAPTWMNVPGALTHLMRGNFKPDRPGEELGGLNGHNCSIWFTSDLATWIGAGRLP